MTFEIYQSMTVAEIGIPVSLHRNHLDPAIVTLTFRYQELIDGITVEQEQVLEEDVHYSLDTRNGLITLLDHSFWQTLGYWRAGDTEESLLYKNQIKYPQRIEFSYEHYAPEEVALPMNVRTMGTIKIWREEGELRMVDFAEPDAEGLARLGYEVPKYAEAVE